jgi:hypothetical protein
MTLSAGDFVAEVLFCVCFTVHDISQSLFSLALGLTHSPTWWVAEAFSTGVKWPGQGEE